MLEKALDRKSTALAASSPPLCHRVPELINIDQHITFILTGYDGYDIISGGRVVAHSVFKAAGWCKGLTIDQIGDWKKGDRLLETQRLWETVWIGRLDKEIPYFVEQNALKCHVLAELWAQEEAAAAAIEENPTAPQPPNWKDLFELAKNGGTILGALFTNHPDTDDRP